MQVNSTTEKTYSSGGHQVHAPLGTVTSQAIPLKEYYYGPVTEQMAKAVSIFMKYIIDESIKHV